VQQRGAEAKSACQRNPTNTNKTDGQPVIIFTGVCTGKLYVALKSHGRKKNNKTDFILTKEWVPLEFFACFAPHTAEVDDTISVVKNV
jgi:hypothetical protein